MNYRKILTKNKRMTMLVIFTYVLIMAFVGIMGDMAVGAVNDLSFIDNMIVFATFQKTPYVTLTVLSFTLFGIALIYFFGHKIMLTGIRYEEITEQEDDFKKKMALNILKEMQIAASLPYLPKLYYIDSDELNAFAAGWRPNNSIVGVTRGLLNTLDRSELQAVIAHEVGHIVHGDSRLTMYIGILANVILLFTNIFARFSIYSRSNSNSKANAAKMILLLLNLILPLITQLLYLFLSRTREYMADAASVKFTGDNQAMINALNKISRGANYSNRDEVESVGESYRKAAYIFNKSSSSLFSTHPSVEDRIKALKGE